MKFTAVGDILCQRRMAEDYEGFREVKEFIERGDAGFFNLETTVHKEGECYGNQFSGGTYIRCNPDDMKDVLKLGFNMVSFNNNHLMDFAHEGILKTLEYVGETGIVHAGVGRNLHEAAALPIATARPLRGFLRLALAFTGAAAPTPARNGWRRIPLPWD